MVCTEKRRARCLAHNHRHSQGWLGLATILTAIARLVDQMCLHHHQRKWSRFIITEEGISLPNVSVGSQFHCTGFAKHPIMPTPLGLTSSSKLCVHYGRELRGMGWRRKFPSWRAYKCRTATCLWDLVTVFKRPSQLAIITHSLTHSLSHSVTHSLTHSLTHSRTIYFS